MAGVYTPTITTFPAPVVTIVSQDNTSYETIQQALISTAYIGKSLLLKGTSNAQLEERIYFEYYDSNGEIQNFTIVPTIDPYQFQAALDLDLNKIGVIFDGRTKMNLTLLANSSVNLDIDIAQFGPGGWDAMGGNLPKQTIESVKSQSIFKDIDAFQIQFENTFDYDFMNRIGFFTNLNTTSVNVTNSDYNELFKDFKDKI